MYLHTKPLSVDATGPLNLMLLVANVTITKSCKTPEKMTATLAHGYSPESVQPDLSNEYQHDRV